MAKNKNRRHKKTRDKKPRNKQYHPKPVRVPIFSKDDIEGIQDQLDTCELAIRISFPAGTAKFDTLESARRVLNHALCGFGNRTNLDKDEVAQATKLMYDAGDALKSAVRRHNDGKCEGFIFTAAEIKTISDGFAIASDFVRDSLDVCPGQTLKEWFAGKRLEARGKYPITNEMIQAEVARLADIPTYLWDTKR